MNRKASDFYFVQHEKHSIATAKVKIYNDCVIGIDKRNRLEIVV